MPTHNLTDDNIIQAYQHFKQTKFLMNFQNSRINILTHFQFETIFNAIAENSSCSEEGETKATSMYCMYTVTLAHAIIEACNHGFPLQPSFPHHNNYVCVNIIFNRLASFSLGPIKFPDFSPTEI